MPGREQDGEGEECLREPLWKIFGHETLADFVGSRYGERDIDLSSELVFGGERGLGTSPSCRTQADLV